MDCTCEGPNETYPNGHLCNTHAPIYDHLESCDAPGCLICDPQKASDFDLREALYWTQTASCCGRPRIVCDDNPCVAEDQASQHRFEAEVAVFDEVPF